MIPIDSQVSRSKVKVKGHVSLSNLVQLITQDQDKASDIEQQPPFGDRKISNIQPQNKGGGYKTNRNII